jgi:transcriptional regulator with XRE-family HTH domain
MAITAAQCRAARGLLNWTQELLATNACVSRATIADFENSSRRPMTNNIRSITDSMFAAGIEFIPELNTLGVGVRFRERKLQYYRGPEIDRSHQSAIMHLNYAGEEFLCFIELDAIDDFYSNSVRKSDEEYLAAIKNMLHTILACVEKRCSIEPPQTELIVTYDMLKSVD